VAENPKNLLRDLVGMSKHPFTGGAGMWRRGGGRVFRDGLSELLGDEVQAGGAYLD